MDEKPELTAGKVTWGKDPWGTDPKDYIELGAGMLTGPGMAIGLGRGIARPIIEGLGGETLKKLTEPQVEAIMKYLMHTFGRGAATDAAYTAAKRGMLPLQKE